MTELIPLSNIKFDRPLTIGDDVGHEGELKWLPLNQLYIDPSYQREVMGSGERNIRKIAEGFDWAYFTPVIVAPRGKNRYAVIDGQHRTTAALCRGDIDCVPCLVVNADYSQQARAFAVINGDVTRLSALHVYRSQIAAGDPSAVAIAEACSAAGVTVAPYPKPKNIIGPRETLAIGTLRTCLRIYGPEMLKAALRFLVLAGAPEHRLINKATIHGASDLFSKRPVWIRQVERAAEIVGKAGFERVYNRAMAAAGGKESTRFASAVSAMLSSESLNAAPPIASKPALPPAPAQPAAQKAALKPAPTSSRKPAIQAGAARRPDAMVSPGPKPAFKPDDTKRAVEAFLKNGGKVSRYEMGATSDPLTIQHFLQARKHKVERIKISTSRLGFLIDGKRCTNAEAIALVNKYRAKENLPPLPTGEAA